MLISCKNIKKSFGDNTVLGDITFSIQEKEKAAIIGANGAGKTTLFKIIAGEMTPDDGELYISKDTSVGYFSQSMSINNDKTVYEQLLTVFDDVIAIEEELRAIEKKLESLQGCEPENLMSRYSYLSHAFEDKNGYEYKSRINGVLKGLGFNDVNKPTAKLSGGEKTRLSLGGLLLSTPKLLLLDEPTNHLDIDSTQWLEEYLKSFPGSVLIISHDRYFLNRTATKIIEIENGRSKLYDGDYTYYASKKAIDREILLKHYISNEREIKRQEEVIKKLRSFNREKSIKRAESREKLLAKMERIEKPTDSPSKIKLALAPKKESGFDVLTADGLKKSFNKPLFENVSFTVKKQEKVALIGPNGIGKTTLFKIILNKIKPDSGQVLLGVNVKIGYYDQEHQDLDAEKTAFDEVADNYPALSNLEIRNALAAFAFTGDDVFKLVSNLSGGEKGRLCILKIMLGGANLLILDEPTNHLDINSKEALEDALRNYSGTCLFISHDRYFINSVADKIIDLNKDGIKIYGGSYDYYLEKKLTEPLVQTCMPEAKSQGKEDWVLKREERTAARKLKSRLERLEWEIEQAEHTIEELNRKLSLDEISTDSSLLAEIYDEKILQEDKLLGLYEELESASL